MATGNVFTLTPDLVQLMIDSIDDGIANFGKDCMLVFPPRTTQCPNCVWDSIAKRSRNVYRTGGPQPFGQGQLCPVCGGSGLIQDTNRTLTVRMLVRWQPRNFIYLAGNIQLPYGVCETLGHLSDLPRVAQASVMYVELPMMPVIRARYELNGEMIDTNSIAQGNYFTAPWKRVG